MTKRNQLVRSARAVPAPEKDFAVTVSVRNNKLVERRQKLGLSQKQLADAAGVHAHYYTGLESLRLPASRPLSRVCRVPACSNVIARKELLCVECRAQYGEDQQGWALDQWPVKFYWVRSALKLATFFACPVEELFPAAAAAIKKRKVTVAVNAEDVEKAVEVIQLSALPASARLEVPSPEQDIIYADFKQKVEIALATLSPREQRIVRARYGFDGQEYTLAELGKDNALSVERVRQIEQKALRRLRHPARTKHLQSFLSDPTRSYLCAVCKKRAGYRCETGTRYCGLHVRPLTTCACILCVERRAQLQEREVQAQRREKLREELSKHMVPTSAPDVGECVLSCPHVNNAGFKFYAFRAGPQVVTPTDTVAKVCICGYCLYADANPFTCLVIRTWGASGGENAR